MLEFLQLAYRQLDRDEQKVYKKLTLFLILSAALEVLGVILMGAFGALLVSGIGSRSPGTRLGLFLEKVSLSESTYSTQLSVLGILAILIMMVRTIAVVILSKRIFFLLSNASARSSSNLFNFILSNGLKFLKQESPQRFHYSIARGVDNFVVNSLGLVALLFGEIMTLFLISVSLFIIDPTTVLTLFVFLLASSFITYKSKKSTVQNLSKSRAEYEIKAGEDVTEIINLFPVLFLRRSLEKYSNSFRELRKLNSEVSAKLLFLPNVTKFYIEISLLLSLVIIGGTQFLINDQFRATANLALFLAAGLRLAPSFLRIQQSILGLSTNFGAATSTINLLYREKGERDKDKIREDFTLETLSKHADPIRKSNYEINFEKVSYVADDGFKILDNIDFSIEKNQFVGIIGESGSGKSTFLDLCIGILTPSYGSVLLRGKLPADYMTKSLLDIGYVPQEVFLVNGTLRDNILLGTTKVSDEQIIEAFRKANLKELVDALPNGINTLIGPRGIQLSGGQKQRIGIARAFLTQPSMLILDEITSSLDSQTEKEIMETIESFIGSITIIMSTHNLSLLSNANRIIALENGRIQKPLSPEV